MSPALILSARILSIRYLPVLEFWQTGSFQEGSWFCLSLLPLSPSTRPRGPNKALAVGSTWLCCRCSVFMEDITPSPGFQPPISILPPREGDVSPAAHTSPSCPSLPVPTPTASFVLMLYLSHTEMIILFGAQHCIHHFCMSGAEGLCESEILWGLLNGKYSFVLGRKEHEKA